MTDLKTQLDCPVVLVGMMGVGKTHIGKMLARALDVEFYDSDALIEQKAGRSVSDIFTEFGEEKFRQSEHNTIMELLEQGLCVIATGGGAVVNQKTLEAIKSKAVSVWLQADIPAIMKRIEGNSARPLLQTPEPEKTLEDLLEKRRSLYAQADLSANTGETSPDQVIEFLIKTLHEIAISRNSL